MTTPLTVPAPIPPEECPAVVQWHGRLSQPRPMTDWSAEDDSGALSTAVRVDPDLKDAGSDSETATVVVLASAGVFRVVATVNVADESTRAVSMLYDIQPGAPPVGLIALGPISAPGPVS